MANKLLGATYFSNGEYKIALKYLKKAYENRNSHEDYVIDTDELVDDWKLLAVTYVKLDEYTNAINLLDKVISATNDSEAKNLKNYAEQQKENYLYNQSRQEYLRQNGYYNNYNNSNDWDY
jgi:tetratricopeptide (TPR) repeat protein